ncbi:hypothetical protein [Agromyces allii]|uniref:DUF4190 domain-containing protein n=1 Tax=Agromyces allii TaxID=393607 RepID=A0ABN2Q8A0_9MICO|nr:hypothetical protein [Agromyces allii]
MTEAPRPTADAAETDSPDDLSAPTTSERTCRHCGAAFTGDVKPGFAGMRRFTCTECGRRSYGPLTRGWRIFWWVVAGFTSVGLVASNILLIDGYSWIPGALGLLSFVVLCIDVSLRRRTDGRGFAPAYVAVLTVAITVSAVSSILGVLVVVGLNNGYSYDVVLQESKPATESQGYGAALSLTREPSWGGGAGQICGDGDDYRACVSMHIAMYNSVCLGELTVSARSTCDSLSTFIDDVKARLADCGSGCTTRAGDDGIWGWAYLRPAPEQTSITNKDWKSEISYVEYCDFSLGPIQIGSCPVEKAPETE